MDAILHCLRKNCFIDDEDSNDGHERHMNIQVIGRDGIASNNGGIIGIAGGMAGIGNDNGNGSGNYEPPAEIPSPSPSYDNADNDGNGDNDEDAGANADPDNDNDNDNTRSVAVGVQSTIMNFLQNLGHHRHSKVPTEENDNDEHQHEDQQQQSSENNNNNSEQQHKKYHHPIKASSFVTTTNDIPTIALSTIVLPGSSLQKKMSDALKQQGYGYGNNQNKNDDFEDECVICMEGFDETNPRMPTLCGCGENKTYFHLPCLYHWIEQSRDCPSCRKRLTWQEF
mmetsp:Transcript_21261/g.26829  ORF Transcript_21261/g.26829 Transcript_21261/m.26829 type:complete len:283 (+) Transcript_21261:317-1165(+)|eukprot:CAMPEP_0203664766 /NCGR_PEP_ID=MMETSP0090-20130426/2118_1 /ASSEMBLY_ACC=CAM_ASM_001088 /TAXON_ID=426623 /ORGANISM="Chaetoceros affinis, Strain CCMP159" /LENGTH=282 /DNA_ID=CAMNT_0050528117 /DNA_START=383 /DNA_END=1231 /DNA_ORIENTATION=-